MLLSVCEAVDPQLLKGGWCDSCPPMGPWDLRASQASPALLAYWYRHSHRQSAQSKQLSWSGRGLDVKQEGCDWELICSSVSCLSKSELVVPGQLSAIYNNFFLSPSLTLSVPSHSTCSSTRTQWRVMLATTTVCCATTRPRPSSTWSSMCAPWSTSAAKASGSFSACRKACQRKRRTLAPSSPFANVPLQTQVRTCLCRHAVVSFDACVSLLYPMCCSAYDIPTHIHTYTVQPPHWEAFYFR